MRTTLNTMFNMVEINLNKITTDMAKINNQLSSGRQMSTISDNPVNMVSALSLRTTLAEIGQYNSNISFGNSMITAAEQGLTGIKELVSEGMIEATMALNDSQTPATRTLIAPKIHALLEQGFFRIDIGNAIHGHHRITALSVETVKPSGAMVLQTSGIDPNTIGVQGGCHRVAFYSVVSASLI